MTVSSSTFGWLPPPPRASATRRGRTRGGRASYAPGGRPARSAGAAALERNIDAIHVYSPNRAHVDAYCREMSAKLKLPVTPAPDARAAVKGADIASVCTNATVPLPGGDWIEPGMHVTNVIREEL